MKKLIASIIIFILVGLAALYLIINKGHIGEYCLVQFEEVKESEIAIPKLTVDFEDEYLAVGSKKPAEPIVMMDDELVTDGYEIDTSDEEIAKINKNNQVVPVSNGKVTIQVNYDGLIAKKELRVITPIKSMSFTTTNSVVRIGKDLQMKLTLSPSDASTETLVYTSSDEEVATVNSNGIVTGVSKGEVTITVYDKYTELERKVNLSIRK